MNKINFNQTGGFPLSTNILSTMQDDYNLYHNYKHLAGDNCIISGCEIMGSRVSDGVMVLHGELVPFIGGAIPANSKVYIKEEVEKKTFEDASIKDVIFKRKAVIGTGEGAILFSSLTRVSNLIKLENEIGNVYKNLVEKINKIELKTSIIQKGVIVLWNKPYNSIPKGWQEVVNLRGKMPIGLDVNDIDFSKIGNSGGLKNKTLSINEMPRHGHSWGYGLDKDDGGEGSASPEFTLVPGSFPALGEIVWNGYVIKNPIGAEGQSKEFSLMNPYRVVMFIEYIGE